jgi:asparagine synthase (glutamine-hydrolysing)
VIETWDIKERHAKFIINSAKVFSFLGYDYIFPLWDNRLVDYLMNIPFSLRLNRKLYEYTLKEFIFKDPDLNLKNEINPSSLKKSYQRIKENLKALLPDKIRNMFLNPLSPIFYDKITEIMLEETDRDKMITPRQPNYYNSYITQWYLLKTASQLEIKMIQ